jgi:hypothetical protein
MRVLLISANTETINMPVIPSGLACVAAAVSGAGHSVELVDLRTEREPSFALRKKLESLRPDVIGISRARKTKFHEPCVDRIVLQWGPVYFVSNASIQ